MMRGGELHTQRGQLLERQQNGQERKADLETDIARLSDESSELKREEKNFNELAQKAEKGQNLAMLATRYREVAGEVKTRAADALRRQMSEHVGKLWVEITEREREFSSMEFDPQWNCFLLRHDGKKTSWDDSNTSAGQRQVRLLAFYEALRRLARLAPPLVVDTPLGRLDKEVKDAVLDRLYLTGHQSIILSTNSEIDPEGAIFDRIENRLARVYTLHPHGKPGSMDYEVRITSDYFGRTL
jgi:DNA sulfur modification protein DndD